MLCNEYRNFTLGCTNGHIKDKEVINHIESCESCKEYVLMFKKLNEYIPTNVEDKLNHVLILIPDGQGNEHTYLYTASYKTKEEAEKSNEEALGIKRLAKENNWQMKKWERGEIPYDNEGIIANFYFIDSKQYVDRNTYYPFDYWYICGGENLMFCKPERDYERPSQDDPNLMECRLENNFGPAVQSSLFMAIPKSAKDIHIIRGNNLIECDNYYFAYVSRHVAEGERIVLEYTYCK